MSGESIRNKSNTIEKEGEKERRDRFNAASLVTTTIRTRLIISRLSTCNSYSVDFKCYFILNVTVVLVARNIDKRWRTECLKTFRLIKHVLYVFIKKEEEANDVKRLHT